jgi:hypothetical protein
VGNFNLKITDSGGVYTAEALHPTSGKLLGFIRFREKEGDLELTNFKAQLSRKALDLGVTSKRMKANQAGTHGEGFKVASLVMARSGYQVRYEASSHYWTFALGGRDCRHLYCNLTPISDNKLKKERTAYETNLRKGAQRELKGNKWEDVTVRIGRVVRPNWGNRISREQFLLWTKVALDLDRPSNLVETDYGTLIQDEAFSNKVYLKGLLLEGHSSSKRFKFGYNFQEGVVNRDRQRLSNPREEAKLLVRIWEDAIRTSVGSTCKEYVDMLMDETQWADVNLAESEITCVLANSIWIELLQRNTGEHKFYHSQDNGDEVSTHKVTYHGSFFSC